MSEKSEFEVWLEDFGLASHTSPKKVQKWLESQKDINTILRFFALLINMTMAKKEAKRGQEKYSFEESYEIFREFVEGSSSFILPEVEAMENYLLDKEEDSMDLVNRAKDFLANGKQEEAYRAYRKLFANMRRRNELFPEVYRAFANMGLTAFFLGEEYEGRYLLEISLFLNPKYVFGKKMMKQYKAGGHDRVIEYGVMKKMERNREERSEVFEMQEQVPNWTTEEILKKTKEIGLSITKEDFEKRAKQYYILDKLCREYRKMIPEDADEQDLLFSLLDQLWKRWLPNHFEISECFAVLEEKTDALYVYESIEEAEEEKTVVLGLLNEIWNLLPSEKKYFDAWSTYYEKVLLIDLLANLLFLMRSQVFSSQAKDLATMLWERSEDPLWQFPLLLQGKHTPKSLQAFLALFSARYPYWSDFFLKRQDDIQYFVPEWEEEFLKAARDMAEKRKEKEVWDLDTTDNTIFDSCANIYEALSALYEEKGDNEKETLYEQKKRECYDKQKEFSYSPKREKMEKFIEQMNKERFEKTAAAQYYDFLRQFPIDLETEEEVEGEANFLNIRGESVSKKKMSRNAPCSCGSGKKYKKCCGK